MAAAQVPRDPVPALSLAPREPGGRAARAARALAAPLLARLLATLLVTLFSTGCARVSRSWPDGTQRAEGRLDLVERTETGLWTYWYPNGALREQGRYERGVRSGTWVEWFPNGTRRAQGERRFSPLSRAGEREGPWTFWHENGALRARGTFRAGRREGHWDFGLDDGGLDGERTGEYHDDRRVD